MGHGVLKWMDLEIRSRYARRVDAQYAAAWPTLLMVIADG